jgi:tetratricopeptide (TPR) repeat protein
MHLCDAGMLRAAYAVMAKAEAVARETAIASRPPPSSATSERAPTTDRLAPGALAQVHLMRARRDLLRGDPFASLVGRQLAVAALEQAQDKRQAAGARAGVGQVLVELGEARAAEEVLARALADSEAMALHDTAGHALAYLAGARLRLGKLDEARAAAARAIEIGRGQQNRRLEGLARVQLSLALLSAGDLQRAGDEARSATTLLDIAPPARALACAAAARVLLVTSNAQEAVAWARMGHSVLDAMGGSLEEGEISVRLALVESLEASGAPALARGALVATCARVNARADGAPDPMRKQAFLTTVAENVRALSLHSAWALETGY